MEDLLYEGSAYLASAVWRHFGISRKELQQMSVEEATAIIRTAVKTDLILMITCMNIEGIVKMLGGLFR